MSDLKREEYASPAVWEELRGLLEIAKRAWAVRTADDPDAGANLDEALDFYDKVALPNHLARIVKETPFPEVPAEPEQADLRDAMIRASHLPGLSAAYDELRDTARRLANLALAQAPDSLPAVGLARSILEMPAYPQTHSFQPPHLVEAARLLRESLNPAYDGDEAQVQRCAEEQRAWLKRDGGREGEPEQAGKAQGWPALARWCSLHAKDRRIGCHETKAGWRVWVEWNDDGVDVGKGATPDAAAADLCDRLATRHASSALPAPPAPLIIDGWTCEAHPTGRTVQAPDKTAFVYDFERGFTGTTQQMSVMPHAVLAWLIRPLLSEAWESGSRSEFASFAKPRAANPYKDT